MERKIEHAEISALRRENELFLRLRDEVLAIKEELLTVAEVLSYIDVVAAGGELAVAHDYVRPQLCEEPKLEIIEGRHPIVECMIEKVRMQLL